jgi:hypothetical protein
LTTCNDVLRNREKKRHRPVREHPERALITIVDHHLQVQLHRIRRRGQSFGPSQPHTPMVPTSGCHVAEGPGSKAHISLACSSRRRPICLCTRRRIILSALPTDRLRRAEAIREEIALAFAPSRCRCPALEREKLGSHESTVLCSQSLVCQAACMRYSGYASQSQRREANAVSFVDSGPARLQAGESSTTADSKP